MKECLECHKKYNGVNWVVCTGCEDVIHSECASSGDFYENKEYLCDKCDKNISD